MNLKQKELLLQIEEISIEKVNNNINNNRLRATA